MLYSRLVLVGSYSPSAMHVGKECNITASEVHGVGGGGGAWPPNPAVPTPMYQVWEHCEYLKHNYPSYREVESIRHFVYLGWNHIPVFPCILTKRPLQFRLLFTSFFIRIFIIADIFDDN